MNPQEIEATLKRAALVYDQVGAMILALQAKNECLQREIEEVHGFLFPNKPTEIVRAKIWTAYEESLERAILGLGDRNPSQAEIMRAILNAERTKKNF